MSYKYENIIFFDFIRDRRKLFLLYDLITNIIVIIDFIDISSIQFISPDSVNINGRGFIGGRLTEITQTIILEDRKTDESIIGTIFNEYELLKFVGGVTHFINEKWSRRFLYRMFDKGILINFDNVVQESIIPNILVRHENYHDVYFIFINN